MQEIIDLVSLKTLHWFSYVANFCWILLGIILSAIFLDIENSEPRFGLLWLKWRQSLKSREIHSEENVINSLQSVITITQRKDIRYCIFINMFLRRENIKRIYIFQYFLHALVLIFPLSSTTRVWSGYKIKTDSTEFYRVGFDWLLLTRKP